ncbi:unnamed protein product [Adineta ricciae]|uniref:Uncharacterized protein n=1 Tax=Adineta ricciae TaxID=249248 RepID=A0A815LRV0_ADIRI|nr:unnamed protein product [Adineta ricciae]CAF1629476.1 unnamed protein product [Adineta ricciae]
MIPSRLFRQHQAQKKKGLSSSSNDDEEETDEEANDNSFYHNPYHSSGQMNYIDVPQQQYVNHYTYPTYLAEQQTSHPLNTSLDEQIHEKLLSLKKRGDQYSYYAHRAENSSTLRQTFSPDIDKQTNDMAEDEENADNFHDGIPVYYPGHYPNQDEHFDLASVVFWYRNVMQSVKKFM